MLKWLFKIIWGKSEAQISIIHMHVHVDGKITHIIPNGLNGLNSGQQLPEFTEDLGQARQNKQDNVLSNLSHMLDNVAQPVVKFGDDHE